MSEPLYTKYRPKSWEDVVEQDSIKKILDREIATNSLKRVLLFTGGAGTGKTTSARIFANKVENVPSNIFELNCANYTGVDDIRELILEPSRSKPMMGVYKIYILDECFSPETLVSTSKGSIPIKDIKIGDTVYNLLGETTVKNIYKKHVPVERLVKIRIGGKDILTTRDHLFFTDDGWVHASELKVGDVLYDKSNMCKLWQAVRLEAPKVLQQSMLSNQSEIKTQNLSVCDLRKILSNEEWWEDLFKGVQMQADFKVIKDSTQYRVWNSSTQIIINKNDLSKPGYESDYDSKNESYENVEWNIARLERSSRWERQIYRTPKEVISSIRLWMGDGVCCKNQYIKASQSNALSYQLQVGPCLSGQEDRDRGGWQFPSLERYYSSRFKEENMFGKLRVESVTFYQHRNRYQFESNCEFDSNGNALMYDLHVEGHNSYFVEDILVHNCHQLTPQAQNALLKVLEEPPSYCIFILCTTDPQKVLSTILSRAFRYDFQLISYDGIYSRLLYILNAEKLDPNGCGVESWQDEAISYIANAAQGHMRNAIALLDKTISYDKNITVDTVVRVLGVTGYDKLFDMLNAILSNDQVKLLTTLDKIEKSGIDLKLFIKNFLSFVLDVNKYIILSGTNCSSVMLDIPLNYSNILMGYNKSHQPKLKHLLTMLLELNSGLKWESNVKPVLETNLLLEIL